MDNSVEALVGFVGSHGDALELLKLAKEDLDQMPPFVHLLVNDETLCPARVLGDNDFGAAFVKIGHDGAAGTRRYAELEATASSTSGKHTHFRGGKFFAWRPATSALTVNAVRT